MVTRSRGFPGLSHRRSVGALSQPLHFLPIDERMSDCVAYCSDGAGGSASRDFGQPAPGTSRVSSRSIPRAPTARALVTLSQPALPAPASKGAFSGTVGRTPPRAPGTTLP